MRQIARAVVALMAAAAMALGPMVSAQAESRTVRDGVDRDAPRYGDIRTVRLNNTSRGLRVTTALAQVRRQKTYLLIQFADGRGAPHRISVAHRKKKTSSVKVQINRGEPYRRYQCKGLTQDWNRRAGRVTVFIPGSVRGCGGAAYDSFRVLVGPHGNRERGYDLVASSRALPPV